MSTWSGVRPTVGTGAVEASRELRRHVVWQESGLVTVTGGKLTTFRAIARDALAAARLPGLRLDDSAPLFSPAVLSAASPALRPDLEMLAGTPFTLLDVRRAARAEAVQHLGDLMLRRTRLGLLLPGGGEEVLAEVGGVCREELGWDEDRWAREVADYRATVSDEHRAP